jgi:curved DNA-binding protein CbpA
VTLYDVLGVPPTATADEVRAAFRRRSRALHPDGRPGAAADHRAITELADAWHVLGDPVRRRSYDEELTSRASSRRPEPRAVHDAPAPRLLRVTFVAAALLATVVALVFTVIAFAQSG